MKGIIEVIVGSILFEKNIIKVFFSFEVDLMQVQITL